ncbi:MAG: hypothetical protein ACJA08_002270 [Cyclobacteriaceae bacterium]|jgi:hypothetical protein
MRTWKLQQITLTIFVTIIIFSACQHDPVFPIIDYAQQVQDNQIIDSAGNITKIECDPEIIYFEKDVLPILISSCAYTGCHDTKTAEEGVILNNYANTIRTGKVKPYNPGKSGLYESLFEGGDDRMPPPPDNALSQTEKDIIRDWIGQGAENFTCTSCDPTVFTYTLAVVPIMDNYCNRCHNNTRSDGGISLQGYDKIKIAADNGSLLGTITHTGGFPLMPQGAAIPDCEISQMEHWISEGAQNN